MQGDTPLLVDPLSIRLNLAERFIGEAFILLLYHRIGRSDSAAVPYIQLWQTSIDYRVPT